MCAQFIIQAKAKQLSMKYGIEIPEDFELSARVLPHTTAYVITEKSAHHNQIQKMQFSLLPSWSKEAKVKFATHNARIETLTEKPTWKKPLVSHRCLVPISNFAEPIYENKLAGNMVRFSRENDELLTAAGIFDLWTDKATGEVIESFSIITTAPPAFIAKTGHDRCPLFLKDSSFGKWLDRDQKDPETLIRILKENEEPISFKVAIDRPLKAGWDKRKS